MQQSPGWGNSLYALQANLLTTMLGSSNEFRGQMSPLYGKEEVVCMGTTRYRNGRSALARAATVFGSHHLVL